MLDSARRMAKASQDVWRGIARVDRAAAKRRVVALRERQPQASIDELHRSLVLSKCIQVGAVSGVARLAGLLPGSGVLTKTVLGPLAEDSLLTMLQAELIVETFDLYGVELPADAERLAVTALAGTHAGARHAGIESARALVWSIQRALGRGLTRVAAPAAEALTGALSQIALTWAIGMRAGALARMPRARASEWPDLVRQFVQFDERRLTEWTTGAARDALALAYQVGQFWLGQVRDVVGPLTAVPPKAKTRARGPAKPRAPAKRVRKAPDAPAKALPRKTPTASAMAAQAAPATRKSPTRKPAAPRTPAKRTGKTGSR
jgi:uncharacterized protein (DUF697 family)